MEKSQLRKRFESFLWRLCGLTFVSLLAFLTQPETIKAFSEAGLVIPSVVIMVVSLITGELTKYFNSK